MDDLRTGLGYAVVAGQGQNESAGSMHRTSGSQRSFVSAGTAELQASCSYGQLHL
jgi:hypothetical protein